MVLVCTAGVIRGTGPTRASAKLDAYLNGTDETCTMGIWRATASLADAIRRMDDGDDDAKDAVDNHRLIGKTDRLGRCTEWLDTA